MTDVFAGCGGLTAGFVNAAGSRDAAFESIYIPDAQDQDVLDIFLPEQAGEALVDLDRIGAFDVLVLDEAQDLLVESALGLFDLLLTEELTAGTWRIFYDHRQNVFSAVDRSQFDRISAAATTQYELWENCRNTPQIHATTCMLSAVSADEVLTPDGPDVEVRFVLDAQQGALSAASIVEAWGRRGVDASDIAIIAPDATTEAAIRRQWPSNAPALGKLDGEPGHTVLATAPEFKGLETRAAVVFGPPDLNELDTQRTLYVACSRARVLLGIVLDEDVRPDFELRGVEFARRQSAD